MGNIEMLAFSSSIYSIRSCPYSIYYFCSKKILYIILVLFYRLVTKLAKGCIIMMLGDYEDSHKVLSLSLGALSLAKKNEKDCRIIF